MITGIHQPNYLPWLGYFRKIARSDIFVFFDNVQMPMGKSFVSRNRIKTSKGVLWLTVPMARGGRDPLAAARIADHRWVNKHIKTLETSYAYSPWRDAILDRLGPIIRAPHEFIATLNISLILEICDILGLGGRRFVRATELNLHTRGAESIPEILEKTGTTTYVTGSGAGTERSLDVEDLLARGIATEFLSDSFPPYDQRYGGFEPNLSIVDALLNVGPEKTRSLVEKNPED